LKICNANRNDLLTWLLNQLAETCSAWCES